MATSSVSPPSGSSGGNNVRNSNAPLTNDNAVSAHVSHPRRSSARRTAAASAPAPISSAAMVSAAGISAAPRYSGGPACLRHGGGAPRLAGG